MTVKRNHTRRTKKRVTSKARRSKTRRSKTRHSKTRPYMTGGNYEKDVTTGTLEGTAIKPLNKMVVTVPGYGTMSGSAYVRLMRDMDRNGKDIYD